jgi:hypothetical protein
MALVLFKTEVPKTSCNSNTNNTGPGDCGDHMDHHGIPSPFPAINQSRSVGIQTKPPREKIDY